jgi:type VI secretion system protein VasG
MNVNLKSLVGRLNDVSRSALEGAAGLCLSRTNYDVEVEHILAKLLEQVDTDLHKICSHFEVNIDRLSRDVTQALDRLKTGNTRTPGLSDRIPRWIQDAWLLASVDFGAARVRSGHLTLALLLNDGLARIARDISREFDHISTETLQAKLADITADSAEARDAVALGETAGASNGQPVTPRTSRRRPEQERSIRFSVATSRSGRSSTSSHVAARIIRSLQVKPASVRPRLSRDLHCASLRVTSPNRSRTSQFAVSILGFCRREPALKVNSKIASSP